MCGIAGIIHKKAGKGVNIGQQMTSMLQALKHRGPDSTGYAMYGKDNGNQILRFKVADHYKKDEWERFNATVTDWDLETYIDCLP